MVHILIEENYAHNNRIDQILQGMSSIVKKKRIGLKLYTDIAKLDKNTRVVILLCASLKWATDTIETLNAAGIHPLLFGFQYIDTMYEYSCITPTYTKTMYLLASHLLSCVPGEIALLGYNSDSLPDRLKLMGVRHAADRFDASVRVFRNKGDVAACIADFAENGQAAKNIVCVNDGIAVILRNEYPALIEGRQMCSCSGMKISEFMHPRYPTSTINYFKAGARLAELYLFLDKCDVIGSTVMTIDMDIDLGNGSLENDIPFSGVVHSSAEVNFYMSRSRKSVIWRRIRSNTASMRWCATQAYPRARRCWRRSQNIIWICIRTIERYKFCYRKRKKDCLEKHSAFLYNGTIKRRDVLL